MKKQILITGGCGYIGSHTTLQLLSAGYQCIIIDDLSNASPFVITRLRKLVPHSHLTFYRLSITQPLFQLYSILSKHSIHAVIHFAAKKSPAESITNPELYDYVNVQGLKRVLELMDMLRIQRIVFSSSATVYCALDTRGIVEDDALGPCNPYGKSKLRGEILVREWCGGGDGRCAVMLRYFNPVGAHPSGELGEVPVIQQPMSNLMPFIMQVVNGIRPELFIFGCDYDTIDGTGVRDYIHVVDLAVGHVVALERSGSGCHVYNMGTGNGYSVKEVVRCMEKCLDGRRIACRVVDRRPGDLGCVVADAQKAERELGWVAKYGLEEMCRDTLYFWEKNPNGYEGKDFVIGGNNLEFLETRKVSKVFVSNAI